MDSFIAIDYETANSSYESVCAVGVTLVENGKIRSNFYTLIKPEEDFSFFDSFNTSIHGITEKDVKNAPSFGDVWPDIEKLYLPGQIKWEGNWFTRLLVYQNYGRLRHSTADTIFIDSLSQFKRTATNIKQRRANFYITGIVQFSLKINGLDWYW